MPSVEAGSLDTAHTRSLRVRSFTQVEPFELDRPDLVVGRNSTVHWLKTISRQIDDLESLLKAVREGGVQVDDKMDVYDGLGKLGWITDPEGNRVELWEPPKAAASTV